MKNIIVQVTRLVTIKVASRPYIAQVQRPSSRLLGFREDLV